MTSVSPSTFDDATRQRIERFPRLGEFAAIAEHTLLTKGVDGIWDCLPDFESLVRSDFVGDMIRSELARILDVPFYLPSGGVDAINIARSRHLTLIAKLFKQGTSPPRAQVYSLPGHLLFGVVGPGRVVVDVYQEAPGYRNDLFDRTRPLGGPELRTLDPGTVACFHAGRDAVLPTDAGQPSVALILLSTRVAHLQWVYSTETLRAERVFSADPMASRLEFAVQALAELDAPDTTEGLRALCDHPEHFVRWSAIRGLIRVDFEKGVSMVVRALDDPHPHVSNAAARALRKIEGDGLLPAPAQPA